MTANEQNATAAAPMKTVLCAWRRTNLGALADVGSARSTVSGLRLTEIAPMTINAMNTR